MSSCVVAKVDLIKIKMKSVSMICVGLCVFVTLATSAPGGGYSGQASIGKSEVKTSMGGSGGQAIVGTGTNAQAPSGKGPSGQGAGGQAAGGKRIGIPGIPVRAARQGESSAKSSNRVAVTGDQNNIVAENVQSLDSIFWYGLK